MYADFHYKDKTLVTPSYFHNVKSYTDKTTSLYQDGTVNVMADI